MHNFIVYISPITINQCKKKYNLSHFSFIGKKKSNTQYILIDWLIIKWSTWIKDFDLPKEWMYMVDW